MSTNESINYIEPAELASLLRNGETKSKISIIDVRQDDFAGGNIIGAVNIPIDKFSYENEINLLIDSVSSSDVVVFHCGKSQQRGPHCASEFTHQTIKVGKTGPQV